MGHHDRNVLKSFLRLSRVKVLYSRVTVSHFTILYFWSTILAVITLSALQGVILADNTQAVNTLAYIVHDANIPVYVSTITDNRLQVCDSIPGERGSNCANIMRLDDVYPKSQQWNWEPSETNDYFFRDLGVGKNFSSKGLAPSRPDLRLQCIYSLSWLEEQLHDSQLEDVAILFYQIWLLTMGIVAILNESIPHLWTSLLGHTLGGAWAATRIQSTQTLVKFYRNAIVPGLCEDFDPLGGWWEVRLWHTVAVVVGNGVTTLILGFLSWKLLKVYSSSSFTRVGASSTVHRLYKLALTFSVGLQLSFFFSLASAAMWIAKIVYGSIKLLTRHQKLYLATFIVFLILEIPFLILGWKSVRKESHPLFGVFSVTCIILIAISSVMFASPLYRWIFLSWRFFATVTVTSYVFLVVTTGLGIACRLNFRKGLAQYLNASDALEGIDFTPVYFPRLSEGDLSIYDITEEKKKSLITSMSPRPMPPPVLRGSTRVRGLSVYSDKAANPTIFSFSPPLISELDPPTRRTRKMTKAALRAETKSRYDDWRGYLHFGSSEESLGSGYKTSSAGHGDAEVEITTVARSTAGVAVSSNMSYDSSMSGHSGRASTLSIPAKAFLARMRGLEEAESPRSPRSRTNSGETFGSGKSDAATTISLSSKAFLSRIEEVSALEERSSSRTNFSPPSLPDLATALKARKLQGNTGIAPVVRKFPPKSVPF